MHKIKTDKYLNPYCHIWIIGDMNVIDGFRTVRLPNDLMKKVEDQIKDGEMGYSSNAEFVKAAVRRELQEVKNGAWTRHRWAVHVGPANPLR